MDIEKKSKSSSREDSKSSKRDERRRSKSRERDSRRDRSRSRERRSRSRERNDPKKDRDRKDSNGDVEEGEVDDSVSIADLPSSSNSNGEIELSIEETNKLRIKLGLRPLNLEANKEKEEQEKKKKKELEEEQKNRKTLELKAKIALSKEERKYRDSISGSSIAEEVEEDSAAAWVLKSRKVETERIAKEKELAQKRAQMLDIYDQVDPDEDEDAPKKSKSKYDSKDLSGLKIAHNIKEFDKADEVILTLKDTPVLAGDDINDEDEQLENINLAEKERSQKYQQMKKKKPTYDIYDESKKSILSQYDDPEEPETFTITDGGNLNTTSDQVEEVRRKLALPPKGAELYSLDVKKNLANEYQSKEETEVKFKKVAKKKKKVIKKKITDELLPLEEDTSSVNHGSRNASAKLQAEAKKAAEERDKRDKAYSRAMEKASEESKALYSQPQKVIEDEDADFFNELQKTREKKRADTAVKSVAEQVIERAKKKEQEELFAKPTDPSLVFTSTTEFIRSIQVETEEEEKEDGKTASPIPVVKKEAMEIDTAAVDEEAKLESMIQQEIKKKQTKKEKLEQPAETSSSSKRKRETEESEDTEMKEAEKEEGEEEENEEFGEDGEPLVSEGIGATLKLLMQKGGPEPLDTLFGRRTDKTIEQEYARAPEKLREKLGKKDVRLEYVDEYGRQLTPKEAFRVLSHRFHGKKPGKNKQEKRMKQYVEEIKRKKMSSTDTPLNTVEKLQSELEKTSAAFLVIGGKEGGSTPAPTEGRKSGNSAVDKLKEFKVPEPKKVKK